MAVGLRPQASLGFVGPKGGDLDSALQILNLYQKQPQTTLDLYSAIYKVLASEPNASFAAVASNPRVQTLCKKHRITHLGGPMLGCLQPDGAKVWIRTLKPAAVEVKVDIGGKEMVFGPVKMRWQVISPPSSK